MKNNFNNKTYNEGFKQNSVKMLLSEGLGLNATAKKIGIASSTLYGWKKKYANIGDMEKSNSKSSKDWSPEQKLEAIIKTASMNEEELGQYLRSSGLHSSDLESFKSSFIEGMATRGRPKVDPEITSLKRQNNELSRSLVKKEKALAEYSARVILLKKSHEIWGTPEEDE